MISSTEGGTDKPWRLVIIVLQFAVLPAVGWTLNSVVNHEKRLATIEASRFTINDALEMERAMNQKSDRVADRLTRLEGSVERAAQDITKLVKFHESGGH